MSPEVKAQMAATILAGMITAEGEGQYYSDEYSKPPEGEGWEAYYESNYRGFQRKLKDGSFDDFKPELTRTREQVMADVAVGHVNAICRSLKAKDEVTSQLKNIGS